MLINLTEKKTTGHWNLGLKSTPKILKVILLLKRSAKSAKKHTKRKLSLTETQRHANMRIKSLIGGG